MPAMQRHELVRKLRALAGDPGATANERAVAAAKADAIERLAPDLGKSSYNDHQRYWDHDMSRAEFDDLPTPIFHGDWADLGAYSRANLHRALHLMPDGSMNCRCHGPGHEIRNGETLVIQQDVTLD
jgi:hypothetical protein